MEILAVIVVIGVVTSMLVDYKPLNKRIQDSDNNPNNNIKSNAWYENNK